MSVPELPPPHRNAKKNESKLPPSISTQSRGIITLPATGQPGISSAWKQEAMWGRRKEIDSFWLGHVSRFHWGAGVIAAKIKIHTITQGVELSLLSNTLRQEDRTFSLMKSCRRLCELSKMIGFCSSGFWPLKIDSQFHWSGCRQWEMPVPASVPAPVYVCHLPHGLRISSEPLLCLICRLTCVTGTEGSPSTNKNG